jgi:hypothetical protein
MEQMRVKFLALSSNASFLTLLLLPRVRTDILAMPQKFSPNVGSLSQIQMNPEHASPIHNPLWHYVFAHYPMIP